MKNSTPYTNSATQQIFYRFSLLYQNTWNSQFRNRSWTAGLTAQWESIFRQMSSQDIRLALDYLKSKDNTEYVTFPPRPLQFLHLPRQIRQKKLPDEAACYQAAIDGHWALHPIVKPIANACGLYWLRTQATDTQGRERFAKHYARTVERFLEGQPLEVSPALTHAVVGDNENVSTQKRTYPLSWAEKIQQHSDRMLALPGAREKIRAAKTAKAKMAVCFELSKQVKAMNPRDNRI